MRRWIGIGCSMWLAACGSDPSGGDATAETDDSGASSASSDAGETSTTSEDSGDSGDSSTAGDDEDVDTTGDGDGDFEDIPLESTITGVAPMTGIVLWDDSWNDDPVKTEPGVIALEYFYAQPAAVVTGPGTYDWSSFDARIDAVAARGHQAIPRFYYAYPGAQTAVPDYLKQTPGYQETQGTSEGQNTWFPDWSSAELEQFHLDFYAEVAARYDDDPRIAFLQTGFGLWGEYHIYDGPNELGEQFPTKEFQTDFFLWMDERFDRLPWSVSIDAGQEQYSPLMGDPALLGLAFGAFDDSFMHEQHDDYNAAMWDVLQHDTRLADAPHGGELSYYSSFDQENALNPEGIYGRTFEELAAQYGISYMIGNDQPTHHSVDRIREAGMATGYRFEIVAFRSREGASEVEVRNDGIAPIYADAWVAVDGVRSDTSLRSLMPGQTETYVVAAGGAAPSLSVDCDHLVVGQTIPFAASLP